MITRNSNSLLLVMAGLLGAALLCCCPGCGYMLGSPQVGNVRTVHVPVFQSESFRRNMDYLLTEAVQREIKTRTAYRLADECDADTVLKGRIVEMRKVPLSETRYDDPRELQLLLGVEVTWVDRRTGHVLQQHTFPMGNTLTHQSAQVGFVPEVGHSMATAQQDAARGLAAEIVNLMEGPGNDFITDDWVREILAASTPAMPNVRSNDWDLP